jgi:H+/Cl- antiporter ClcA
VSGTGVLARFYGTQVADGFFHEFSGWVIYVAAFLLLFAFGWLIDRFNPSRRGAGGDGAAVEESTEIVDEKHVVKNVEGTVVGDAAPTAISISGERGAS